MRELKFRVWSKRQKTYDYEHPFNKPGNFYINQDGVLFSDFGNSIAPEVNQGDFIVEQYTGLKDADGKEIYEGDVVEYVFNVREAEVSAIGEVCFFENQGVYGMKNVKYNNQELRRLCDIENERAGEVFCIAGYDNTDEDQTLIFTYDYFVDDDMEILGNTHENPELLGEEQ